MSNRETQSLLDEARRTLAELTGALDAAEVRAIDIGAHDTLERIAAAKAATKRGADCLNKLRATLLGPGDNEVRNERRPTPETWIN